MRPSLASLGDVMLDVIVRSSQPLAAGTDVPGSVHFRLGGSAANTARAFAGLGGAATFIGAVGDDRLGARLTAGLRASGVKVRAVRMRGPSPRLLALVDARGERSFVTDRGVADRLAPAALRPGWFRRLDALHLPAYSLLTPPLSDAARSAVAAVRAAGGLVSVDLASSGPLLKRGRPAAIALLTDVASDVLFGNRAEAAALVGARLERRLLELAPIVVVKLGDAGCRVLWRGGDDATPVEIEVATKPLAATDTTGAGDAFDAGFLYSLMSSGYRRSNARSHEVMRRAAVAGNRAAARLLTQPRPELVL